MNSQTHNAMTGLPWHIRYSPKTTALFSNLAEPRQHAVDDATLKTFCGRDASGYWQLDESAQGERHVTCAKCRAVLGKGKSA